MMIFLVGDYCNPWLPEAKQVICPVEEYHHPLVPKEEEACGDELQLREVPRWSVA